MNEVADDSNIMELLLMNGLLKCFQDDVGVTTDVDNLKSRYIIVSYLSP